MKLKMILMSLVAIFILSSASSTLAQDDKKMAMKMDAGMSEMMNSSHHRIAMAYKKNINTLASVLKDLARGTEPVNPEFVRAIAIDIKSASAMMDRIHMDHMSKMKPEMKEGMAPMMEKMKKEKEALASEIEALGLAANAASLDMKEIEKHATAIAKMTGPDMMQRSNPKEINLKFTVDEVNQILEGPGMQPFAKVYGLIVKIQDEGAVQLN